MAKPNLNTPAAQKWRHLIKQFDSSGMLHATEWCRNNNISYDSFIYWRRHLKDPATPKVESKASFIELVNPSSQESGICLQYHGFTVALSKDFDEATLFRCLQALRKI